MASLPEFSLRKMLSLSLQTFQNLNNQFWKIYAKIGLKWNFGYQLMPNR